MNKILLKIKQRFCNHKLGIFYSSHYPTVHCVKCGKYATDDVNRILGEIIREYIDEKNK